MNEYSPALGRLFCQRDKDPASWAKDKHACRVRIAIHSPNASFLAHFISLLHDHTDDSLHHYRSALLRTFTRICNVVARFIANTTPSLFLLSVFILHLQRLPCVSVDLHRALSSPSATGRFHPSPCHLSVCLCVFLRLLSHTAALGLGRRRPGFLLLGRGLLERLHFAEERRVLEDVGQNN